MKTSRVSRFIRLMSAVLITITFSFSSWGSIATFAQVDSSYIQQIDSMEFDHTGISQPYGLVFSSHLNAFFVVDGKDWKPAANSTDLIELTQIEARPGSARILAGVQDPLNMAYDNNANRLLILQAKGNQLLEVQEDSNGNPDPSTLTRHNVRYFGAQDPKGLAVDSATGDLFILDAAGPKIIRVTPGSDGSFEAGVTSAIDLQASGITASRGIALDPSTEHLHVFNPTENKLYELTQSGEVLAFRDLSQFDLKNPQAMVFAPSGDQTDDPLQTSLYVADTGSTTTNTQSTGQIVELSFLTPSSLPAGTTELPATLVRTFNTNWTTNWPYPSPDPSGIDYWPLTGQFLISDSEVEESINGNPPAYWHGYNVFYTTLSGSTLLSNCTTYTPGGNLNSPTWNNFTNEPAGFGINPFNNHMFFSNDGSGSRVIEVAPGADGQYCTPDDQLTVRSTLTYGASDSEDVTYGNNTVAVADGKNGEVYIIPLGPDGVLSNDDGPVTHWDTSSLGFDDLEGIGYNPDHNTLFIVSTKGAQNYLGETTFSGQLVNVYDLSFMGTVSKIRSDVTYAPSSQDPSVKSIYIASRGVDNNTDRLENDGKVWEISLSSSTPPPPPPGGDLIFADGFESGDFSAWSSSTTDGGNLSVSAAATLVGANGMQALINDNNAIFVTDESPNAEPVYNARFYFDPNSISMASGDNHFILYGYSGTHVVLRVQFRFSSGVYQMRASMQDNASSWINTSYVTISDAPHAIEVDWQAATSAGANDGGLTFWIDGSPQGAISGIANDTWRIDSAELGAVNGIDTGTRGTEFFDAFESHRQTYIGP